MRVALETNGLYVAQAGVARYIHGLRLGFAQMAAPDLNWVEFAWPVENFSYHQPQRAIKTFYREVLWAKLLAPLALRKMQVDLLHSTCEILVPPSPRIKQVTTLHDLAVLRFPHRFRRWHRSAVRRRHRYLAHANRIICVSRFTANEAMELLGLPASRLEVVYHGCDFPLPDGGPAAPLPDEVVPSEFFLFVGSLEPGKNLALLKEAYVLANRQGCPLPALVIVGARWAGLPSEGPPPPNWHYLGRQPDWVLEDLYRRALALLFPSRYEGFGFPLLEAMTLGCPVVCSRVASLPEVGGNAVFYADLAPAAYLDAMQRLAKEAALREDLIAQGRAQARQFSWKRCAESTLGIYRQVWPG